MNVSETVRPDEAVESIPSRMVGWYDPDSVAFDGDTDPDPIADPVARITALREAAWRVEERD